MKQIEKLISRVVQLAEDNKGQLIHLTLIIDADGNIAGWVVNQQRIEGAQVDKMGV
jgi:hypothetical protein